jgi:peptidoglycan DL-endopeptidase CwlO
MGALLTTDNPQAVLSQASVLLQLSSDRSAQVNHFLSVARQLNGAQQMARRTQTAIAALNKQRLARRQSISKAVSSEKAILATLTASQQTNLIGAGGTTSATYTGSTSTQAGKAVAFAYMVLNAPTPYVYGGNGPPGNGGGYDCSGLVKAAWAAAGVYMDRVTNSQAFEFPRVRGPLEPGDLIFFNGLSHVGMYVGGGDMIDAPRSGLDVERVPLSGWYTANEDWAVRP